MNKKLTLTIEQSVIEKAKKYASQKGRSLSYIVENYLKVVTKEEEKNIELTPIVKSMKGSFKAPKSLDYKKELSKSLKEHESNAKGHKSSLKIDKVSMKIRR